MEARNLGRALRGIAASLAGLLAGCVVAPPQPPMAAPPRQAPPPMYFYPELSQTDAKQDRDRYECYRWAVAQSGVDPGMTPVRDVPPPRAAVRDGSAVVAGAVTGAAVGAVMSSPRHGAEGAIIGAIFGTLLGAAAQESRAQAAEQAYARRQAYSQVPMDNFRRAMGACMTGRGYRIG